MLLKCCTQYASYLENSAVATVLEKVCFHFNPKEVQWQKLFNYCISALISNDSKVMLEILQTRLQQSDGQAGFRKDRGSRDQITNIHCILEKERGFQKNIYFCFIDYTKDFDYADHNKLWKILKRDGLFLKPPYLSSGKPVCRSRSNS